MSKVSIKLDTLKGIGNAVRAKKGTAEQIPVANLASEIGSIQTGTDTSKDTVTAETMLTGITAHNASGEQIEGTIPTYDGAMRDGLESYPKFQEKTATENGEVVPDEGFDGLSKVTVNVPSGGGSASKTIVVNSLNYEQFPAFLDGFFVQISSEEFTAQELEKTILYLHFQDEPISVIAPQSYLEKHYGDGFTERTDCEITTVEVEDETTGELSVNAFIFYIPEDIIENDLMIPKGLYISAVLSQFALFTIIINP